MLEIALALIWRRGCLLLARRLPDAHLGGCWEFPGGKIGPGETAWECARREAMEELGVTCEPLEVLPAIEHHYPDRCVRLIPVACRYEGGPPRAVQAAEWRWVHPSQLGAYSMPEANAALVRRLAGKGRNGEI